MRDVGYIFPAKLKHEPVFHSYVKGLASIDLFLDEEKCGLRSSSRSTLLAILIVNLRNPVRFAANQGAIAQSKIVFTDPARAQFLNG